MFDGMTEHVSRLLEKLPRPLDFDKDAILEMFKYSDTRAVITTTFIALLLTL